MGNPKGFLNTGRETPQYRDPKERIKDFEELPLHLGEEKLKNQSGRCMDCGVPFCMSGCPLGNLIPDFNDMVYNGQWEEAVRTLYATNNFPEFTGRICPAPCESSCVLGINEPPVTIKQMEFAISEKAAEWDRIGYEPLQRTGKKVAIVGSGPSGLACAQQLNRAGHRVKVFEKAPLGGGLLTWGIPAYKLPKDIVERRIRLMREEGIDFVFGVNVGDQVSWKSLVDDFDALVLCIGSEVPRDLKVEGREGGGIHFAMEFLEQQTSSLLGLSGGQAPLISAKDKDVIVIGGGDTGADCIGTSLRQGARSVVNFELMPKPPASRSPSNPWPQYNRSYNPSTSSVENDAHGGRTEFGIRTDAFELDGSGHVKEVKTSKVHWRSAKVGGRPEMVVREGEGVHEVWPAQLVLLAMGYVGPRTAQITKELDLKLDHQGRLQSDADRGIFAAGDCRRGQSLVVWAIAEGREIAAQVDQYLKKEDSLLSRCRLDSYQFG